MPDVYQYKTKRKAAAPKQAKARAEKIKEPAAGPPWFVQGQNASSLEYNVSQALERLGVGYQFQYYVKGGRLRRGGGVVDFFVYTPGRKTLLEVNGRYWHTGKHEDELQVQQLKVAFPNMNVLIIWEEDCLTIDNAMSWIRNNMTV